MAETKDDQDNHKSYIRGFNDARNQRPSNASTAPNEEFYNLGYEDGEKDE